VIIYRALYCIERCLLSKLTEELFRVPAYLFIFIDDAKSYFRNLYERCRVRKRNEYRKAHFRRQILKLNRRTHRLRQICDESLEIRNIQFSEDNGKEALEDALNDVEAEFLDNALEHEIVTGDGLLVKFVYVFGY